MAQSHLKVVHRCAALGEVEATLRLVTEMVADTLRECGIPYRDLCLRWQPQYEKGSLLISFEVQKREHKDMAMTLLDMGVGPGAATASEHIYFSNITSAPARMWHRIDAVVITH